MSGSVKSPKPRPDFVPMLTVYESREPLLYRSIVRQILAWRAREHRRLAGG